LNHKMAVRGSINWQSSRLHAALSRPAWPGERPRDRHQGWFNPSFSEWSEVLAPKQSMLGAFPALAAFGARFPGPGVATKFALTATLSFSFVLGATLCFKGRLSAWMGQLISKGVTNALPVTSLIVLQNSKHRLALPGPVFLQVLLPSHAVPDWPNEKHSFARSSSWKHYLCNRGVALKSASRRKATLKTARLDSGGAQNPGISVYFCKAMVPTLPIGLKCSPFCSAILSTTRKQLGSHDLQHSRFGARPRAGPWHCILCNLTQPADWVASVIFDSMRSDSFSFLTYSPKMLCSGLSRSTGRAPDRRS
jgi:hypothetical protein